MSGSDVPSMSRTSDLDVRVMGGMSRSDVPSMKTKKNHFFTRWVVASGGKWWRVTGEVGDGKWWKK